MGPCADRLSKLESLLKKVATKVLGGNKTKKNDTVTAAPVANNTKNASGASGGEEEMGEGVRVVCGRVAGRGRYVFEVVEGGGGG